MKHIFSYVTRLYHYLKFILDTAHFEYQSLVSYSHKGIVVEPYSIRVLVADCPIQTIFKHSHLDLFHSYVVVNLSLRGFQQLKQFAIFVTKYRQKISARSNSLFSSLFLNASSTFFLLINPFLTPN